MHKIFLPIILIAIFVAGFIFSRDALKNISVPVSVKEIITNTKETCGEECKKTIKEEVAKALSKITPAPTAQPQTASSKQQTSYVPLDGTFTTTSTSWTDLPGTDVAFDINQDYGAGAKVAWEASLKVAHGNGQAYARLFDVTHGIAVLQSEISTTNNVDYKNASSGNLNLWAGRNTYRVQIKSLNSFEVSYTGGKIRISYNN